MRDIDLNRYNTVIAAGGYYSTLDSTGVNALKQWLRRGNTLIALNSAVRWAISSKLASAQFVDRARENRGERRAYITASSNRGAQIIGGAIFRAYLDRTHPLAYGYRNDSLPVFRRGTLFLKPVNPYATPLQYAKQPLLAGYISEQNHNIIAETASTLVAKQGNGRVILMLDNPTFRAYWYGTQKLLANALFFGPTISLRTLGE